MKTDLIERLQHCILSEAPGSWRKETMREAADRLAALEAEASEAGCMCRGVEIGSHMASVSLPIPSHMADYRAARVLAGLSPMISVDACLVVELRLLWARGIRTYGSCCGHNKVRGMVNVHEDDTAAMLAMGYEQWPEKDGMAVATFYPKSARGLASEGERRGLERALEFANFEAEAWGYADGSSARVAAANIARAIRELPEAPAQPELASAAANQLSTTEFGLPEAPAREGELEAAAKAIFEQKGLHLSTGKAWERAIRSDRYYCLQYAEAVLIAIGRLPPPPPQDREPDSQRGAK